MAKAQQGPATDIAKNMPGQVASDVAPVVSNATAQQQKLQGQADTTLGTSTGLEKGAEGTYSDFAKTGGFSPTDETAFLNRATRGVSGTYDVLKAAADRRRAAAGGLGTGGEDVALARHAGQDVAEANTNAMAVLKQQENANKLAGAGGLSGLYGQTNQLYDTQTGAATAQGKQILDALGLKYNTDAEAGRILASMSKNPSALQQTIGDIQSVAGVVGPALAAI